jgi:hypothetical protein
MVMNINQLEMNSFQYVYVWVKPAGGKTWQELQQSMFGVVNNSDWRPARVAGVGAPEDHIPGLDDRRVTVLGFELERPIQDFEFGELISSPDYTGPSTSAPILQQFTL